MISRYIPALGEDQPVDNIHECYFLANTNDITAAAYREATLNIIAAYTIPATTVSVQITHYTDTNNPHWDVPQVLVNGVPRGPNYRFDVTIGADGKGSFVVRLQGNPAKLGTSIMATFTITWTSDPVNTEVIEPKTNTMVKNF